MSLKKKITSLNTVTIHRKLRSNGFIVWYCKINNKDEGGFMTKEQAEVYAWLRITK